MAERISLSEALLPLIVMILLLLIGGQSMAMGPSLLVPVMLAAAAVAGLGAWRRGKSFADIERATGEKLMGVLPVLLILLAIGMLIGSWMIGGTIPYLVYLGLKLVDPRFLLVTAFLVTSGMSLASGTSWGSAGTVGVALMGLAGALGVPLPACAGAVLSGAYLGDKMSPLSDSTNISAIGAGVDLYEHIRHMLYTALPSFLLCCLVYTFAGLAMSPHDDLGASQANLLLEELARAFRLNPLVLIPPAIIVLGIVRKTPPLLAMAVSSLAALVIAVALHGFSLPQALTAAVEGFRVEMLPGGHVGYSDAFLRLVNRGGLYSMVGNFVVILAAFLLASGMGVSGALDRIIHAMLATARGIFGLITATMAAGLVMIGLTSHGGVTALVVGGLFQDAYRERGLAGRNLSRSIEDSVTITEPLMPWTVSAVFMATTLGVPTLSYLPWAVFCFSGPVFSLTYAALAPISGAFGIALLEGKRTA